MRGSLLFLRHHGLKLLPRLDLHVVVAVVVEEIALRRVDVDQIGIDEPAEGSSVAPGLPPSIDPTDPKELLLRELLKEFFRSVAEIVGHSGNDRGVVFLTDKPDQSRPFSLMEGWVGVVKFVAVNKLLSRVEEVDGNGIRIDSCNSLINRA